MASPALESFCCMRWFNESTDNISHYNSNDLPDYKGIVITYNALCIVSSALSVCGAGYQLLPKQPRPQTIVWSQLNSVIRQNILICWLTIADLLASLGVLVRSCLWISGNLPVQSMQIDASVDFTHLFCAISSGWIQYFYTCTYFWTFIYAVDVFRLSLGKPSCMPVYHVICWGVSAFTCGLGLLFLFYPSQFRCVHDIPSLLPTYLSSYVPMCLVMIANPILYSKASSAVERHFYCSGNYTRHERDIIRLTKRKFREILVVFYVCWFANIVNGILLLMHHYVSIPRDLEFAVWHIMAVLNPLQAFLNSIIYRGVGLCYHISRQAVDNTWENFTVEDCPSSTTTNSDETSPLMYPI